MTYWRLQDIKFALNVQHDCCKAKCTASGLKFHVQERTKTCIEEPMIEHKPLKRFLINLHAFHNAHLVRRTLPRSLWAPVSLYPSDEVRRAKHNELAASLRALAENKATKKRKHSDENDNIGGNSDAPENPKGQPGKRVKRNKNRTFLSRASK
jgi:hypothetical protein